MSVHRSAAKAEQHFAFASTAGTQWGGGGGTGRIRCCASAAIRRTSKRRYFRLSLGQEALRWSQARKASPFLGSLRGCEFEIPEAVMWQDRRKLLSMKCHGESRRLEDNVRRDQHPGGRHNPRAVGWIERSKYACCQSLHLGGANVAHGMLVRTGSVTPVRNASVSLEDRDYLGMVLYGSADMVPQRGMAARRRTAIASAASPYSAGTKEKEPVKGLKWRGSVFVGRQAVSNRGVRI